MKLEIGDTFREVGKLKKFTYEKDGKLYEHEVKEEKIFSSENGKVFLLSGTMIFDGEWFRN